MIEDWSTSEDPTGHGAISRDPLPGPEEDAVAGPQRLRGDGALGAVVLEQCRIGGARSSNPRTERSVRAVAATSSSAPDVAGYVTFGQQSEVTLPDKVLMVARLK